MLSERITNNAPLFAVMILVILTVIVFVTDDSGRSANQQSEQIRSTNTQANSSQVNEPSRQMAGSTAPQQPVLQQQVASGNAPAPSNEETEETKRKAGAIAAPMLANLIIGLEKKVAADPENVGSKMLLAQSYAEVGELSRGLDILRELEKKEPDNIKIHLVLASVLGKSDNPAELNEALALLNSIEQKDESKIGSILLQRGRLYIKMGEKETARQEWNQALNKLPEGNGYRKQVEKELARLD